MRKIQNEVKENGNVVLVVSNFHYSVYLTYIQAQYWLKATLNLASHGILSSKNVPNRDQS